MRGRRGDRRLAGRKVLGPVAAKRSWEMMREFSAGIL